MENEVEQEGELCIECKEEMVKYQNPLIEIIAYSRKSGAHVTLYYRSIEEAKNTNPGLVNFREVRYVPNQF